ncbi:MAG TPA: family 10 glycosylhydrolase [Gemmatimonadaceae bacterium]|nr:family 10 glycosylhydrolase [Gemmatimonadaceae bacterium]
MCRRIFLALLLAGLVAPVSVAAQQPGAVPVSKDPLVPPPVAREFRGAWVAAVSHIDWPSRGGLTTGQQKAELLAILDRLVELRMNAVVLHVRPAADALYESTREPWSAYLTGKQGRAPSPFYDPLAFAVREAHRRGLELHAWFNPFRAFHPSGWAGDTARTHVARSNPRLTRRYGDQLWMDPGDPEVRRRSLAVIADVVRRYDIDAVHLDDYFYPYRIEDRRGRNVPFPDDATYRKYRRRGGRLSRNDWRRDNVNQFVRALYEQTRRQKPHVRVGISPFGIWRPGYPAGITGLDAYAEIYADSRLWLRKGWVDYFAPQLYWHPDAERQSFARLLEWWGSDEQNPHDRHIWAGLYTSRVVPGETNPGWDTDVILRQIRMARQDATASGQIHYSMRALQLDPDSVATRVATSFYAEPALPPASPWLDPRVPPAPEPRITRDATGTVRLELRPAQGAASPWLWTVQQRDQDGRWTTRIVPGAERTFELSPGASPVAPYAVWVSAVSRVGVQSDVVPVEVLAQ